MRILFVDCETTGLVVGRHEPFEIAIVDADGKERAWWLPLCRPEAMEESALRINRFWTRRPAMRGAAFRGDLPPTYRYIAEDRVDILSGVAADIAAETEGCILAGNVVSFDAAMIGAFLRENGACPAWHYHLLDVETFAAGALGLEPPWDSDRVSAELGVAVPRGDEAHTALADARWSRAIYYAALMYAKD